MSDIDVATDISQTQGEVQPPVQQEKMVPQSKVNDIVAAKLMKEREALEAQYRGNAGSMGGMQSQSGFDKDALMEEMKSTWRAEIEKQQREAEEAQQRAQIDAVAKDYLEKMKQGPELYEDFQEVTKGFSPSKYPQVTILAGQMENTPDIIYELKKNPQKLTHLHVLALTDPDEAQAEMTRLSKSIKRNEEALANNSKSPSPLSKIKTSARAGQDTGKRTVSDLRKDSRFRG